MSWLYEPTESIPTAEECELLCLRQAKELVRVGRAWMEDMKALHLEDVKSHGEHRSE